MQPNTKTVTVDPRERAVAATVKVLGDPLGDPQRRDRIVSTVQIVVGVFLLIFGYWIGRDHCRLVLFGAKTAGKLVGYEQRNFSDSGGVNWTSASMPIIEFQTQGRSFRFRDWVASNFRTPMGGFVPILYDPERPSNAMIDRPVMNWIPWAPMMAVGTLLLFSGLQPRTQKAFRTQ